MPLSENKVQLCAIPGGFKGKRVYTLTLNLALA